MVAREPVAKCLDLFNCSRDLYLRIVDLALHVYIDKRIVQKHVDC